MLSVLLVDNDPSLLEMLVQMAQRSKELTILPAQSESEAAKILMEKSFDAIIAGSGTGIDGIGFTKTIRGRNDLTPVIILSSDAGCEKAADAINCGANYFMKKGKDPHRQFPEIAKAVKQVYGMGFSNLSRKNTSRIIADLITFSSDPVFAIDRAGTVIAWNDSMEQLADFSAESVLGKGEYIYAEPFHGSRRKVLVDLIFATDEEIKKAGYMIVSRVKNGSLIAVIRGRKKDGSGWTIWSKAMPVFDVTGTLVAVVGTARDVTATFGDIVTRDTPKEEISRGPVPSPGAVKPPGRILKRLLNSANSNYKEGVSRFAQRDFRGAITAFDQAIAIDDTLPYVWNDRGAAYRELGEYTHALKSCLRAVELAPESPQCLFTLGETLEQIGIMYMSTKYLDSAIQTFRMVANQLPNNADAWNHIGTCQKAMGNADESKFSLDRARDIRLGGKHTPVSYTRDEYL